MKNKARTRIDKLHMVAAEQFYVYYINVRTQMKRLTACVASTK